MMGNFVVEGYFPEKSAELQDDADATSVQRGYLCSAPVDAVRAECATQFAIPSNPKVLAQAAGWTAGTHSSNGLPFF